MKVRTINKGYYGGIIRDAGDKFDIPDKEWDDPKVPRPSWVQPVKTVLMPVEVDAADADSDDVNGGDKGETADDEPKRGKRGRKPKAVAGLEQLPPVAAPDGTGVVEGLGGQAPDWLPQAATK